MEVLFPASLIARLRTGERGLRQLLPSAVDTAENVRIGFMELVLQPTLH
jgi:hypothetical protein